MLNDSSRAQMATGQSHASMRTRSNVPPLPRLVQEHLGQQMRADYFERGAKPQYLGDPALPLEFDPYLYRLEQKERTLRILHIEEHGTQAVADALSDLLR
jgi:hypothetical protein